MYDMIRQRIETNLPVVNYINNPHDYIDRNTGELVILGTIENMKVKQVNGYVYLKGSPAKYLYGNNLLTLTCHETKRVFEKLNDNLHIETRKGIINKIHFETNIFMDDSLQNYFSCLGSVKRLEKSIYPNGIAYQNGSRSIGFYNKTVEYLKHHKTMPDEFKDKNILRYGIKLNRNPERYLHTCKIIGFMLYEGNFFNSLLNLWKNEYISIMKVNKIKFKKPAFQNVKTLLNQFSIIGMNQLGMDTILENLEAERTNISPIQYARAKKKIIELINTPGLTEPNQLIKELDKKILETHDLFKV